MFSTNKKLKRTRSCPISICNDGTSLSVDALHSQINELNFLLESLLEENHKLTRANTELSDTIATLNTKLDELVAELRTRDEEQYDVETAVSASIASWRKVLISDLRRVATRFEAKAKVLYTAEQVNYDHDQFLKECEGSYLNFLQDLFQMFPGASPSQKTSAIAWMMSSSLDLISGHKFQWDFCWNLIFTCKTLTRCYLATNYMCHALPGGPKSVGILDNCNNEFAKRATFESKYYSKRYNLLNTHDNFGISNKRTSRHTQQHNTCQTAQQVSHSFYVGYVE